MGLRRQIRRVAGTIREMRLELRLRRYARRWSHMDRSELAARTEARLARQMGPYFWLFVLGVNNSGTSMLSAVLGRHPVIHGLPREGQFLTDALPRSADFGVYRLATQRMDLFRWTEDSEPDRALKARFDWSFYYPMSPGILLEKTPLNALRSRWLQRHFHPARFIAIVRNPYSVCEGIRRRTGATLEAAAEHWVRGNEVMLGDLPSLRHAMLLTYEDFCADPGGKLEQVRAFLGLRGPFDPSTYTRPIKAPVFDDRSRPVQDLNGVSLARLSPRDIEAINRMAWPLAGRLGYAILDPVPAAIAAHEEQTASA